VTATIPAAPAPAAPARLRTARRRSQLWRDPKVVSYGWPLAFLCLGMPIWFFLGLAPFVWSVPGLLWGFAILARPARWKVPHGGAYLGGAVVWIALSGIQVQGGEELMLFGYRLTLFVSTFAMYLFVSDAPQKKLPIEAVSDWLSALFISVISLGWLGLILGRTNFKSPFQLILPGAIADSAFIDSVSRLRFAEVQGFGGALGFDVPRPSAPFAYTNGWGSAVGLLAPYFAASWLRSPVPRRRRIGLVFGVFALVPIIVSMNRALWASLLLCVGVVTYRKVRTGDLKMARNVLIAAVAAVVLTATTPLGNFVVGKFDNADQSNDSREGLYEIAFNEALKSPILGFGTPKSRDGGPPIGTHGLVWWLMYCHGFIALGLFTAWMARITWAGRKIRKEPDLWAYISVLVFVLQFPVYGMLPQLPIAAVSAGLVHRSRYPEATLDDEE
jgi:hypothetical protein